MTAFVIMLEYHGEYACQGHPFSKIIVTFTFQLTCKYKYLLVSKKFVCSLIFCLKFKSGYSKCTGKLTYLMNNYTTSVVLYILK